ncbi:hypothetical protein Bhyg_12112 [Pseudolycoriella hygida]|uniref:Uncharacterized protein n=1 Tax=Pseudolycoriella hygida TaxID=35572 RepID=A0A9Q0MWR4_9DIPT|nr:hypothetical protein Bhyg_12112 [Pseudolycoriella hygida]
MWTCKYLTKYLGTRNKKANIRRFIDEADDSTWLHVKVFYWNKLSLLRRLSRKLTSISAKPFNPSASYSTSPKCKLQSHMFLEGVKSLDLWAVRSTHGINRCGQMVDVTY